MDKAYAIRFAGGGYLGNGHAHGQSLFMADLFGTHENAEQKRLSLAEHWEAMKTARTVTVKVSK